MADAEVGLPRGLLFGHFDLLDSRHRRSRAAPRHHGINALRLSLENGFHAPVTRVAGEPSEPEGSCALRGLRPKEDALDLSGDVDMNPLDRHGPDSLAFAHGP